MSVKDFNINYLVKNKPAVLHSMCATWNATLKWSFDFLIEQIGNSTSMLSTFTKSNADTRPWGDIKHRPRRFSVTMENSLKRIANNSETSRPQANNDDGKRPVLSFIDDDLLRSPQLSQDYYYPHLHKFLRLQRTSFSVWPKLI